MKKGRFCRRYEKSDLLPALAVSVGYTVGIILLCISGGCGIIPEKILCSVFASDGSAVKFAHVVIRQTFFFTAVFLCGFTKTPSYICAAIVFCRSLLAGYSSALILYASAPMPLYFMHTALSVASVIALVSSARAATSFSKAGSTDRTDVANYASCVFFFAGIILIMTFVFNLLTFVM